MAKTHNLVLFILFHSLSISQKVLAISKNDLFQANVKVQKEKAEKLETFSCDVIIIGGSAAALGAALASAGASRDHMTCLTEPTDWLGGQLTTAAVSAIDFGNYNKNWWFQSQRFQDMMESVGNNNPGDCWVSTKCFLPGEVIKGWIQSSVEDVSNLKIFYNTVPISVSAVNRTITSITVVRRISKQNPYPWNMTFSQSIKDWYSPENSSFFDKEIINLQGNNSKPPVVIEATEYGDVLVLANASYTVGVEVPDEDSPTTIETCGQCTTFPFYMGSSEDLAPNQTVPNPGGKYSMQNFTWDKIWTYRRSLAMQNSSEDIFKLGDISNQNWGGGNDFCGASLFLSHSASAKVRASWTGGLNISAIAAAERRAYGWFHYYKAKASKSRIPHLYLDYEALETQTGLPKIPYLRDSRRSIGIKGFKLKKSDMVKPHSSSQEYYDNISKEFEYLTDNLKLNPVGDITQPIQPSKFSTRFNDSIGLGDYFYADIHGVTNCPWPAYIKNNTILPYHIPFRALSNIDFDNLLVAGKMMAQTFQAQAATRMHPSDFTTGEAAGTAAVMMQQLQLTTEQLYQRVDMLQRELIKSMPIYWDKPRSFSKLAGL